MADQPALDTEASADASFLIGLCFAEQTGLLESLFTRVYVAPAVWREVVIVGMGRPGAAQVAACPVIVQRDIQNHAAAETLTLFLGAGESETLILAQESGWSLVLMDDLRARKAAQQSGLKTLGVVGFLLTAKGRGLIPAIKPLLERLLVRGFRLGQTLINTALREAGEE